jgi:UPF0755 protein
MKNFSKLPGWIKIAGAGGAAALFGMLGFSGWWNGEISPVAAADAPEVQFEIPSGTSTNAVGKKLVEQKIIKSEVAWKLWTSVFSRQTGGPKMGSYQLSASKPLPDIAAKLWSGRVTEVNFTIPEGANLKKMDALLASKGFFPAGAFIAETTKIPRDKFPWLPADIKNLEGFVFPNTYSLPKEGINAEKIVTQMLKQFEKDALPVYQAEGAKSNLSLLQWVSLSSVVEKEAVIPKERHQIAGVFINRLAKNIKLESDPTVEYAFGIKQTPTRPLYFSEVRKPHPYNTYTTPGIPPGPIASPGLGSLKAVLNPDATEMIFFVAKYDGTHIFSRTNAEHEKATREIRAGVQKALKKPI